MSTYFRIKPVSYEKMGEIKKDSIKKNNGQLLFGYPAYVCCESGELFPLPTPDSKLYVSSKS